MDENATSGVWKKHGGRAYLIPFGVLAENVETDAAHQFLTDAEKKNIMDAGGGTVRFEAEPAQRKLLESGSRPGRLFAWINRWLRDLKTVAFTGSYQDLSDRPQLGTAAAKGVSNSTGVTQDGYVADARAVKAVNDKFGGMSFTREGGDIYAVYTEGADTVRKKLGKRDAVELPLDLLTSGNGKREITAGPVDFTGHGFLKLVYDYETSNREALHISICSGENVLLEKYLAKGYSKGELTLQGNLESVVDVGSVQGECTIRMWADDDPDSGGGMDGLGDFTVKAMVLYGE